MDKKIETFEVELKDFNTGELHKFTCLSVPTKLGYSVGVAPQSLENAIQEYIENDRYICNYDVTSIDTKYAYVLHDEDINWFLKDGKEEDIYDLLRDCDEEVF
jgi:hypothetical protein